MDMRDDFAFDVIDHQDISTNIDKVLSVLNSQLEQGQYFPAPLALVDVPKNYHSVRPGTVIPPADLIVLYAIAQQIAPALDAALSDCVYSYRLNPRRARPGQPLFDALRSNEEPRDEHAEVDAPVGDGDATAEIGFPYNWFANWLPFNRNIGAAAAQFEYVAVTDITAYFENISLDILLSRLRELLSEEYRVILDRLEDILRYWDWVICREKPRGTGLPQGNDVSSFLSNIYLRDVDEAMLEVVGDGTDKYHRYVDDMRLYTDSEAEGRRALVALEGRLRSLGLNTQSAKTKVQAASDTRDADVGHWMQRLEKDSTERGAAAREFLSDHFDHTDPEALERWQRVYLRSLTVLGEENDASAVAVSLHLFLHDPSAKMLWKNFRYLRRFAPDEPFEEAIRQELLDDSVVFEYHRAYLYRLAAYSRQHDPALLQLALADAAQPSVYWFRRVGALLYLSTSRLSAQELASLARTVVNEGSTQVARALYVVLCQQSGDELAWLLNTVSYFSDPHQEYLKRYFLRLVKDLDAGVGVLTAVRRDDLHSPFFIRNLHKLDLVKANNELRPRFREVLEEKLDTCREEWPRLRVRLEGIREAFIDSP